MMRHPAHFMAQGLGSGLAWVVPGTFGTLFGWLAFVALMPWLDDLQWAVVIGLGFGAGCWACHITGRNLGVADHGSIVWDEIIAIWIVLWILPKDMHTQAWAVFWFRVFDMVKPPPIRYFDRKWKNGFGVMFDDVVAAFMTLLSFAIWVRL